MDEADSLGSRGGGVAGVGAGIVPHPLFDDRCGHWASPSMQRMLAEDLAAVPDPQARAGGIRGFIMGGMNGGGGGMGTLQALLTEMSGLKKPRGFWNKYVRRLLNMTPRPPFNYRILTIMATNQPDVLDPALLRPGRVDRKYKMGYPSADGRQRTYEGYLAKVSHVLTPDQVRRLAVISTRATGASIKDIVNEALVIAIRDGRDTINYQDMIKAKHLKAHGPADDWTYSDWEGHAVAVHEASHADRDVPPPQARGHRRRHHRAAR